MRPCKCTGSAQLCATHVRKGFGMSHGNMCSELHIPTLFTIFCCMWDKWALKESREVQRPWNPYRGWQPATAQLRKSATYDRTPIGTWVYPNCATHWFTRWSLEGPRRCQPHGASIQNAAIAASDLLLHRNWTFSFEIDRAKQKQWRQSLCVWANSVNYHHYYQGNAHYY